MGSKRTFIARARTCEWATITAVIVDQSMCTSISFRGLYFYFTFISFFFVCDLEVSSLDLSYSGHCARRRKRLEAEEARQTVTQEGNYQWLPILWIIRSMGSHYRYYFVTMLAFSICSSSSSSSSSLCFFGRCIYRSIVPLGKSRFFLLVLRQINYGLY